MFWVSVCVHRVESRVVVFLDVSGGFVPDPDCRDGDKAQDVLSGLDRVGYLVFAWLQDHARKTDRILLVDVLC